MVDESKYMAVERKWRRGRGWGDCDEGSGTVAGVMLILVVALLMGALAAGGAVLIAGAWPTRPRYPRRGCCWRAAPTHARRRGQSPPHRIRSWSPAPSRMRM